MLPALHEARERTLALVAPLSDDDLERVTTPILSPLVWDLGHIAAYEDLWLNHRYGGLDLLHPELAAMYDAFETPRPVRGHLPLLDTPAARGYLDDVRERAVGVLEERGPGDGVVTELVVRHEHQHCETMLQALVLGGLVDGRRRANGGPRLTGLEPVAVAAGPCDIGAPDDGFAYDNERPRHRVHVPAFRIGRVPVTNATYLRFAEGGGYERREWWSDEAWHWKEEYDISHPQGWTDGLDPDSPVVHVSWFEAAAFARAHGARLPTEAEWEKAATSDQLAQVGEVWEWTGSEFTGYAGFRPFPYREYSEVFFDRGYRVLRGGSWASSTRVVSPTFRNWDLPERRQIFSGIRLAWNA
ncbi:MAG: gamma-glutamyl hercynylcysteine S-oxide synthase [Solirubrobacteraceae bacterium]|nr:gamma-glutamyl hercynylcysteine S-oxide synthase [Solirubrobacteraceae bacterium]